MLILIYGNSTWRQALDTLTVKHRQIEVGIFITFLPSLRVREVCDSIYTLPA